jgi:hypothetical protein
MEDDADGLAINLGADQKCPLRQYLAMDAIKVGALLLHCFMLLLRCFCCIVGLLLHCCCIVVSIVLLMLRCFIVVGLLLHCVVLLLY